ncbi:MAG: HAMP domain-containing sensor histidine kinase [Microcella sp.]|uniref:sensor histidine kinase n=1 Tax=Microcella sp. TaxID=1913979 RepID=UPI00271ED413|nr:HAMP domain-containing sensor histidine kinase [Microcella sp.]MDO8338487.1 HAMP domain-containing sensor histidine kinase [Microcella sp.]
MRRRLIVVFLVPLVGVLLVLGGAYAWSAARSVQQEQISQLLGDVAYFVTSARQALRSGSPDVVASEAERYYELYGTRVQVIDRSGAPWVDGADDQGVLDEATTAQIQLALAGRRGEVPEPAPPWALSDTIMVEPVIDTGEAIGAVVITASGDVARETILRQWGLLLGGAILATTIGILVVFRLANWVLRPVRRVDRAMEAIERGEVEARIADETGPPELRSMIRIFNRMAGEIERVMSRQQEFALNASHELRNPLNALLVRVEYLATGLDEEWERDVEETREEGRRMTRILDTLLNLARSGERGAAAGEVDVVEIVRGRVDAWTQAAAREGVDLVACSAEPVLAITDRTILESALDAVIDNAVKFSPASTRVEVSVSDTGEGCEIIVRDHGPGVEDDELAHLAERFWRSPRNRSTPGSGLGLAIATDLLHSIGGRLRVESPEGGGLAVHLRLTGGEAS